VEALEKLLAFAPFAPESFTGVDLASQRVKDKLLGLFSKAKDGVEGIDAAAASSALAELLIV
jgi:hypothetical protein